MREHEINSILCKYILNIFQKAVEEPLNGMWLSQIYMFFLTYCQTIINGISPQSS